MEYNNDDILNDRDNHSEHEKDQPEAYHIEDDKNLKEEDLERYLYGNSRDNMKPVMEGKPMGGHKFGQNNNTPAGNDKNNPTQYAGHTNAYFNRTEPSEEHPENSNFMPVDQDGWPDYRSAQPYNTIKSEQPKLEKVERGNGENDRPHKGEQYQEGTADNDSDPNVPGPNELPDQQKVGEDTRNDLDEREHIET